VGEHVIDDALLAIDDRVLPRDDVPLLEDPCLEERDGTSLSITGSAGREAIRGWERVNLRIVK